MSETTLSNLATRVRSALEALVGRGAKSTDVSLGLSEAREMERAALAELAAAEQDHAEAVRTFDRERGLAALARQEAAAFDRDAAREAIRSLEAEERGALASEEQVRLQADYDAAAAALAEGEEALIVEYPALAHRIREIVRLRAEVDLRVETVNKALPLGAEPLQTLAARYFTSLHLPRENLSVVEIEAWVSNGRVIPDEFQKLYRETADGFGEYQAGRDTRRARRRRVRRTTFLPKVGTGFYDGFANTLTLPGLAGEPSYFRPADSDLPRSVLDQIEAIEAEEAAHRMPARKPEIEDEILPIEEPAAA